MKKILFPFLIVFTFLNLNLSAQNNLTNDEKPLWLRIDDAIQKVESGETGEAVYLFRKILEDVSGNPESEMWLGLIFDKENEYELAVKHLEKALEHKKQLVILEDQYRILYKLADISYKQGDDNSYINNLSRVIEYSEEVIINNNLKNVMLDVLKNKGYGKFIELYRPSGKISLKAYGLLGKYYFYTENWNLAIDYLMYVTGAIISNAIEEIKNIDPYFVFLKEESIENILDNELNESPEVNSKKSREEILDISLENIFDIVNNTHVLKEYFKYNSFYEYFYYLGKSLKNSGYIDSGSYILEKIYIRPETGKWGSLSNPR